jgi:phosphatidylserine/phosphatidylglycerophosphate/cardiolipin synthase-like enzyme
MAGLLTDLVTTHACGPVVYLSTRARGLTGPVTDHLQRNGFPDGAVLTASARGPRGGLRGRESLHNALERLAKDLPSLRWVLLGDDAPPARESYTEFARRHPARVAAIGLRTVAAEEVPEGLFPVDRIGPVPIVRAPDGDALRRVLQRALTAAPPRPGDVGQWFLSAAERGNGATRLRAWTEGNAVRPLVHGSAYFPALAAALAGAGDGDLVLFADWRGDPDERLTDDGLTVAEAFSEAAARGALVKGLIWRSHLDALQFSAEQNRDLSENINADGGEVLLDQRVRPLGSHHQKFVVVRHPADVGRDVAFLGGVDLGHSRRDDSEHGGDPQHQRFSERYGDSPAWHDAQLELRGPAVRDVEDVFRERWEDPAALSRLPWQALPDIVRRLDREPSHLPDPLPDPPRAGSCAVQLLRTYPNRWPGYPFAPDGERSAARGYAKALRRARRLVYIEDQYLWSASVARVFAEALRAAPRLHLVAVVPRFPEQESRLATTAALVGHTQALDLVRDAGGDRVQVLDVENRAGEPVYVHAKVCVIDDVWAAVGSDNFNRRSWTHDSELTAAVLDDTRDAREPTDPAGLGDGARRFARDLRLALLREHLDREAGDDADLVDPDAAVDALRTGADALDRWHAGGRPGPRPLGRLRPHRFDPPPRWQRLLALPAYHVLSDPDGRPPRMKFRRTL